MSAAPAAPTARQRLALDPRGWSRVRMSPTVPGMGSQARRLDAKAQLRNEGWRAPVRVRAQMMTPIKVGAARRNMRSRLVLIDVSIREVPESRVDVASDFCQMEVGVLVYLSHP